jgi:putative spermidine/putrescine transport system ATP-binding protein
MTTLQSPSAVTLRGVTKRFGSVVAVDHVDLQINEGEFFSVLGPSGSGKTTVLRLIAGFDQPDEGSVLLAGEEVAGRAPFDRDVNTVFQDYALFPHMSVQKNVEYGLKVKGVERSERVRRAREMLDTVRLSGLETRRPSQLSGGQRQRVALARALVNQPKVLLLDEPLGALDLKLREEMQVELKSIQQVVGITFIYVTHDQGEALSMSDRIAVFNGGRIEQVGTARDLYERPASAFVASFVGTTNLFSDDVAERLIGKRGVFTLRPEHVRVRRQGIGTDIGNSFNATVIAVQYLGADSRVYCALSDGSKVISRMASDAPTSVVPGESVVLSWSPESVFTVTS